MTKIFLIFVAILLLGAGCGNAVTSLQTTSNSTTTMHQDTQKLMEELSQAFEHKDVAALKNLASDPYDGIRFIDSWTDQNWQSYGKAFRGAVFKSGDDKTHRYEIIHEGQTKEIQVMQSDGKWKLVYYTLVVTPHM